MSSSEESSALRPKPPDCGGKAATRTPRQNGETVATTHDAERLIAYFVSLCGVCLRHHLQYFFNSIRSGCVRLFFVVE